MTSSFDNFYVVRDHTKYMINKEPRKNHSKMSRWEWTFFGIRYYLRVETDIFSWFVVEALFVWCVLVLLKNVQIKEKFKKSIDELTYPGCSFWFFFNNIFINQLWQKYGTKSQNSSNAQRSNSWDDTRSQVLYLYKNVLKNC